MFAACGLCLGESEGKVQVLLLGDSTTIGSVCRMVEPNGPHLEDVIRELLAAEPDLPAVNVINQGRDGEYIHGLLTSGRYEKEIKPLQGIDYVFIRYGLNDRGKREDFSNNFPKDLVLLINHLREDFPGAMIIPTTIIPYLGAEADTQINLLIQKGAEQVHLPVFDLYSRYEAELKNGPNMLNYRRFPLEKIPERHRVWVKPYIRGNSVEVMDNRLDAHFADLPGWFSDRHPNLAGYHVIGDETAIFLARLIRTRQNTANQSRRPIRRWQLKQLAAAEYARALCSASKNEASIGETPLVIYQTILEKRREFCRLLRKREPGAYWHSNCSAPQP